MTKNRFSRRDFLKAAGLSTAAVFIASCSPGGENTPPTNEIPQTGPTTTPGSAQAGNIIIAVGGWAVNTTKELLQELGFTEQTGVAVDVQTRPGTASEFITQMTSAIRANSSPYDVIDFEDEIAITFSRAGFLLGLDDILPADFWDDFPPTMMEMARVWDQYNDETFRIHHNYEANYYWYRKDWFDQKGVEAPKTWDDVRALGEVFTDEGNNVWATEDGLQKGAFLNVYMAWITLQAGGNPFDVDDAFRTALEYTHELMYDTKSLNPASLQKDYDQQNADYTSDRVAFMRQWPFFYDVSRSNESWYQEGKAEITLPPVGPGGKENSTYAAGWGFGIPRTTQNVDASKQLVQFLVDQENAAEMAKMNVWWLSARSSVLEAVGNEGIAQYLRMYTDEGIIGVRPFHPKFLEALTVIEDTSSAYLTDQISLDDAMTQARDRMATLE